MSQTGDYQGLGLPSRRIRAMLRAAFVALAGALVLAGRMFVGAARASSGPVAEIGACRFARHPTDLLLHWLPFGGTPPGYPTGEVVAHTNVVQNDTRVHVTLLNGLPDTQYVVSIACQRAIGSFNTND